MSGILCQILRDYYVHYVLNDYDLADGLAFQEGHYILVRLGRSLDLLLRHIDGQLYTGPYLTVQL